ncbi:LOW QUALITY PROTEIN: hypothetical protein U9M48_038810 [Paspalum notatum var. saurae]|uniref:Uncharacterized protein n=1 Tax=Paspalum notatum var. saurae TaxID=547442 RepID=A0AAQ3UK17_PASNO
MDRWLLGCSVQDLAPSLLSFVSKRALAHRTVHEALQDHRWVCDIGGGISAAIVEFLKLWDALVDFPLHSDQPDQHVWTPDASGVYSASSAYKRFFLGSTTFEPCKHIWRSAALQVLKAD